MLIAGLDIARSTGMAWIRPGERPAKWKCLTLAVEAKETWAKVDEFAEAMREQLAAARPDFVAIEKPLDVVIDYGAGAGPGKPRGNGKAPPRRINAETTISLAAMTGAAIGILDGLGLPFGLIGPRTWHARYFGSGFKPSDGDWKAAAVQLAELQGILLPPTKAAAMDAADAIGIAASWTFCNVIPARHHQAFMRLRGGGTAAVA